MALQQDPALVWAVFEYRAARTAVDLFNQGNKGYERLSKEPALQRILLEMHRAQQGDAVTLADVYQAMESLGDEDDG